MVKGQDTGLQTTGSWDSHLTMPGSFVITHHSSKIRTQSVSYDSCYFLQSVIYCNDNSPINICYSSSWDDIVLYEHSNLLFGDALHDCLFVTPRYWYVNLACPRTECSISGRYAYSCCGAGAVVQR